MWGGTIRRGIPQLHPTDFNHIRDGEIEPHINAELIPITNHNKDSNSLVEKCQGILVNGGVGPHYGIYRNPIKSPRKDL